MGECYLSAIGRLSLRRLSLFRKIGHDVVERLLRCAGCGEDELLVVLQFLEPVRDVPLMSN